jgi:NADH-quinone oxidoreductase subunit J
MLHLILFSVFAAICVAGAVNLLVQTHPINSALSLVVVMGSLAVEYLLLGAEFVAAVQVIVYAGAIMVLFVFVIMLLNAGEEEHTQGSRVAWLLGLPGMLAVTVIICWVVLLHSDAGEAPLGVLPGPSGKAFGNPADIAQLLFHEFLLPFEVTSILVLIAIMGAVVLAARPGSQQEAKREG